jgi:H+/Cl- antiporter ClcA
MSVESSHEAPDQVRGGHRGPSLYSRGYLVVLGLASLIGIPISFIAFGFLAAVHELEHLVWHTLPTQLGFASLPAWWPILSLGIGGLVVAFAVSRLPGHGGDEPARGLGGGGADSPSALPGVILAAGASLVLGAVLGPDAPLIALGAGLAMLAIARPSSGLDSVTTSVLATAGSAAAVSAIFGNPLIAAVIFLEVIGLARRQAMLVLLPCLASSGIGALVFTGLGGWTGLEIGALAIPQLPAADLAMADLAATIPIAAIVAVGSWGVFEVGRRTATLATARPLSITVAAGLLAGSAAAVYTVATDHGPAEVALSGQAILATLAVHPEAWSAGSLVLLVACKAVAYALCLGAFRGGPVFPAIFLGAACGTLASMWVPSIGTVPGLAIGMAAGATASTRFPVTGILIVVLLLGDAAMDLMPVVILAGLTALVVEELLTSFISIPNHAAPQH